MNRTAFRYRSLSHVNGHRAAAGKDRQRPLPRRIGRDVRGRASAPTMLAWSHCEGRIESGLIGRG